MDHELSGEARKRSMLKGFETVEDIQIVGVDKKWSNLESILQLDETFPFSAASSLGET